MMETKFTPGPLRVEQDEEWPFQIRIVNAAGEEIETRRRYASSSDQRTLDDCLNAVGFDHAERPAIMEALARQLADAHLRAAAPDMFEALEYVREHLLKEPCPIGRRHVARKVLPALARARGEQP